jgi:hypothetical protein
MCVWENVISSAGYVRTRSLNPVMVSPGLELFRGPITVSVCHVNIVKTLLFGISMLYDNIQWTEDPI